MSNPPEPVRDPQDLLADTESLVHRVRRAQRNTWSALLVLGVTVLLAIPFYRDVHYVSVHCQTGAGGQGTVCVRFPTLAFWYWPVALVLAYAVIGVIFVVQARSRGVGTRIRPYIVGGIVLVVAATLIAVWNFQHPLSWGDFAGLHLRSGQAAAPRLRRLVGPLGVIGLGLLVLARVERSRALARFTVLYLVVVLATAPVGFHRGPWAFLPGILVSGLFLLAGSAVFALLERPAAAGSP